MSEMTCLHCSATTSNGLALCELCQYAATSNLEYLPVYFRNLARWKPGRAGSRPVPGSRVLWDGETRKEDDRIGYALSEASTDMFAWVACLVDDRSVEMPEADTEADAMAAACRLLAGNVTSIATLEWAGEFVKETTKHEQKLGSLTLEVAPGWYAGECSRCKTPTHVVPGLTWVKCGGCGVTTYARDHLDAIMDEARGWKAKPMDLAKALVALVDGELSVPRLNERIKKWSQRGHLTPHRKVDADGDEVGPKRYEFGQVITRLFDEGPTRLDAPTTVIAKVS